VKDSRSEITVQSLGPAVISTIKLDRFICWHVYVLYKIIFESDLIWEHSKTWN
jgi:hypothetical protein